MEVVRSDDPAAVLSAAGSFLRARSIENGLILSILEARVATPEPGLYAWASNGDDVCGLVLQSPIGFVATMTAMPREAVDALVTSLDDVDLPGINGEASTTAMFAGAWASRRKVPARPAEGMRLYSLGTFVPPPPVSGSLRQYLDDDFDLVVEWMTAFSDEIDSPLPQHADAATTARRVIESRGMWLWEDAGEPVCMVGAVRGAGNVSRIGPVFTPADKRGYGYAAACTGGVTQILLDAGEHPTLYTQLANPVSNSVYQRLGYEPVMEAVRYTFG